MNYHKYKSWALVLAILILNLFLGCTKDREPTAPTEIQRPKPFMIEPTAGKLVIPLNETVKIVFNEPMDVSTFPGHFFVKDFNGNTIDGSYSVNDSIVIFTPHAALTKSNFYFAELRGRIRDQNRNSIEFNNEPILDDTTLLMNSWFYTEGDYAKGGFYNIYVRDKKDGRIVFLVNLDSAVTSINSLSTPEGLAISENGDYLIIANTNKNEIIIASALNGAIIKNISVASNPTSCLSFGNYAYVLSVNGKAISKINLETRTLEKSFTLNFFPAKLAISADGNILYTYDQVTRDLVLINSSDGSLIKRVRNAISTIVVGEIRVDRVTANVFLCDSKGRKVKVTDSQGNSVHDYVTFGPGIEPIDISFFGDNAYVLAGNSFYKYEKSSGALLNTLTFTSSVKSLSIVPSGDIIYITLATKVVILDYATLRELKEIDLISTGINTILSNSKKF